MSYVSRAGEKLEFALKFFNLDPTGLVCADFGSSTGGFVDCLLQHGAKKVYAVETGYGLLDWKLREDTRVTLMERTNAMYVELPEKVDLITIDTGWTKQAAILPSAYKNLKSGGRVISLVKISFEIGFEIKKPKILSPQTKPAQQTSTNEKILSALDKIKSQANKIGFKFIDQTPSPILGKKGKNPEYLVLFESYKT